MGKNKQKKTLNDEAALHRETVDDIEDKNPDTTKSEAQTSEEHSDSELADETSAKKEKGIKTRADEKKEADERYLRLRAEFDNYRKRTEKEKAAAFEIGARSVLEKILPIVDNFERGIALRPDDEECTPFAEGMDKIYKQLVATLEDIGVSPIEAVGTEFDPSFHNAVMQEESDEYDSNIVTDELQKGYKYKDSVIRYSMVKVSK